MGVRCQKNDSIATFNEAVVKATDKPLADNETMLLASASKWSRKVEAFFSNADSPLTDEKCLNCRLWAFRVQKVGPACFSIWRIEQLATSVSAD